MENIRVRRFRHEDAAETARIYFDAVRIGAASHYDRRQREAWAPNIPKTNQWLDRLSSQTTLVAEHDSGLAGFMSMMPDGYIDLAYVAPQAMGKGVASKLYEQILVEADNSRITRLHAEASHLARSFFERVGWTLVAEQCVVRNDVQLTNFRMEKVLRGPPTPASRAPSRGSP